MASLPRVASLLPSATEMVSALGLAEALVGVSHECDWPPAAVRGKPVLTASRIRSLGGPNGPPNSPAGSRAIDRDVRRVLRDALAVYDVDLGALERAAPDVIVTQDLCDVCAVSFDDVCRAAASLGRQGVRIVSLRPTRLAEIFDDLARLGTELGREPEASAALVRLRARVEAVRSRAAALEPRPRVLTIEWLDPVMIGGLWMPELVELAGGVPLVTRAGQRAPTLSPDELAALDPAPDVVLVKPCGFALEQTLAERAVLSELLERLAWPAIDAGAVWIADGNAFFNRPGPRIVDSLEILAACIHPDAFADFAVRYAASLTRLER